MDILIKGMEMPTTCGNCWFCRAVSNEKWHCRLTGKSFASYSVGWGKENNTGENGQHPYIRRDDCPLVPVPPHGRLIDANALIADVRAHSESYFADDFAHEWVDVAPTIIPADDLKEE